MPTVLRIKGFRFFFYSEEGNEPIHIHIAKGNGEAKVWLEPIIKPNYFNNFKAKQQREIIELITKNRFLLIRKWYEYFKNK